MIQGVITTKHVLLHGRLIALGNLNVSLAGKF